jgi:hypothetical protein
MKLATVILSTTLASSACFAQLETNIERTAKRIQCIQRYKLKSLEVKDLKRDHFDAGLALTSILGPVLLVPPVVIASSVGRLVRSTRYDTSDRKVKTLLKEKTSELMISSLIEYDSVEFKNWFRKALSEVKDKNGQSRYSSAQIDKFLDRVYRDYNRGDGKVFRKFTRKVYKSRKTQFNEYNNVHSRKELPRHAVASAVVAYIDSGAACSNIGALNDNYLNLANEVAKLMTLKKDQTRNFVSFIPEDTKLHFTQVQRVHHDGVAKEDPAAGAYYEVKVTDRETFKAGIENEKKYDEALVTEDVDVTQTDDGAQ